MVDVRPVAIEGVLPTKLMSWSYITHNQSRSLMSSFFCFGSGRRSGTRCDSSGRREEKRASTNKSGRFGVLFFCASALATRRGSPSLPFESTPDLSVLTTKAPSVPGAFGKSSKISNNLAKKERAERERRHDNHQHNPYNAHYIFMTL